MKIILLFLFLSVTFSATAQSTIVGSSEPMKALNFLVGKWNGKVNYEPGAHQFQEALWTTHVYYNVGGNILIIDEKGSEVGNPNNTTVEVLVIVLWDSATNEYPARLHWSSKSGAGSAEGKVLVHDKTFVLQMNDGASRFTVRLNEKGQWQEVGENSQSAGGNWQKWFDMLLNRTN